ncbi:DUF6441 family protein [Pelagibacterium montanilacus]|uniref:DUF6441 family protein n=1 Tax=Pelagibacterium montanilacus TaxID=2185280 RepID=UPI000F8CC4F0|nr:DUF6441 family protein [Pelagibacterium montanilacus]
MRLRAALTGDLEVIVAQEQKGAASALSGGTHRAAEALKDRLRQLVMSTLGSRKVAMAWRSATYPRPPKTSMGPAASVWTNAPKIIDAFSKARLVRSDNGFFLAIPSPDAPESYMGRPVTPSNFNEERYGPLRFVYRRTGPSLLVVDAVKRTRTGRVGRRMANDGMTKTGRYRKGYTSVVMFFLVPFVKLRQLWDLEAEFDRAQHEMVRFVMEAWQ